MKKKVIVLGLDGLDPSLVEEMLAAGELPAFRRLRELGCFRPLATTCPAQTPVAWSSFATGTNPGGHGIFDFVRRDPETYLADFALSRFEPPRSIFAQPRAVNRRRGVPFWQVLARAGVPATVLRCPCTFPPDPDGSKMLSGVGVPDMRGSQGAGAFYTQNPAETPGENEQLIRLEPGDEFTTRILGPRNTRANPPADALCALRVRAHRAAGQLEFLLEGLAEPLRVQQGAWSPWARVEFTLSPLQTVSGIVRFYARQVAPPVEFYVSPVNFDPAAPLFPISAPAGYARELAERIGLYSTLGMAEDHTALTNGRLDERAFLEQCELVLGERERMAFAELDRFSEGLFFVVFDTPDRAQHMLWRFQEPAHPAHDPDLAREFGQGVREQYRRSDRLLARMLEFADGETLFLVLSDHGFSSFRRAFHANSWLCENSLLALRNHHKPDEELGEGFSQVDWSKTSAYALGLAGIYLNLKGREREGILEEGAEAERVRRAIAEGLTGLKDPATGQVAIRSVARREELYSGACVAEAPDLLVNYAPGFRVSWQTALGGMPRGTFEDNRRRWSGDHIIDPALVPGILFANRTLAPRATDIRDLAPTILRFLGVPPPDTMEGAPLLAAEQ